MLARRYLLRDRKGRVAETPSQLFARVARAVAKADIRYGATEEECADTEKRFLDAMQSLNFLPNSPTLMNAGRENGQLAACFVVPVTDDTDGIFQAVSWAARIQKTGGGTGFSFSSIRPGGDLIVSTGGQASGPVSFMQVFDVATEAVKQGGTRRGANMAVLRVDHPDILEFIAVKLSGEKMQNFNLSVGVTDDFMSAVEKGRDYPLRHPVTGKEVGRLSAARVFESMVNAAWATGDPGVVFLDTMNASNPTPELGAFEATNPCGEQPLLPFESCTLGSINLAKFVAKDKRDFDWERLGEMVALGAHFLDNVLDENVYPLEEIATKTRATRKIGLGVMGWADALIDLGFAYGSQTARELGDKVAAFVTEESVLASQHLAETRGVFPAYAGSVWAEKGTPMRNATTTTVAPTGTISIIAGCSSGIEPLFALAFERHVLEGDVLAEFHPALETVAEAEGCWSSELKDSVLADGHLGGRSDVPAKIRELFATSHEISVDGHVGMQAVFQRHVHAAVSKTINLPNSAQPSDVERAYKSAYQSGCKGVTVYRDGSKATQVLTSGQQTTQAISTADCPECSSTLSTGEGCSMCPACGYSVCG